MLHRYSCTLVSFLAAVGMVIEHQLGHHHRRLHQRISHRPSDQDHERQRMQSTILLEPETSLVDTTLPTTVVNEAIPTSWTGPQMTTPRSTARITPTISHPQYSSLAHIITKAKRDLTSCPKTCSTPTTKSPATTSPATTSPATTNCANVEGALNSWTTSYTAGITGGGGALAVLECYSSDPVSVKRREAYSGPASITPICSRESSAFYNCFEDWTNYVADLGCCPLVVAPPPLPTPMNTNDYLTCSCTADMTALAGCFDEVLFMPGLTEAVVQETVVSTTVVSQWTTVHGPATWTSSTTKVVPAVWT